MRRDVLPCLKTTKTIRLRDIRVLMIIDLYHDPVTSYVIADFLRFDPGTVSRATQSLLEAGYIKRKHNKEDGRSPLFSMKKKGEALAQDYRERLSSHFEALSKEHDLDVSKKDMEVTYATLMKLAHRSKILAGG